MPIFLVQKGELAGEFQFFNQTGATKISQVFADNRFPACTSALKYFPAKFSILFQPVPTQVNTEEPSPCVHVRLHSFSTSPTQANTEEPSPCVQQNRPLVFRFSSHFKKLKKTTRVPKNPNRLYSLFLNYPAQ
jgi:hypothetical protein